MAENFLICKCAHNQPQDEELQQDLSPLLTAELSNFSRPLLQEWIASGQRCNSLETGREL